MTEEVDTISVSSGGESSQEKSSINKKTKKVNGKNKCKIILNTSGISISIKTANILLFLELQKV